MTKMIFILLLLLTGAFRCLNRHIALAATPTEFESESGSESEIGNGNGFAESRHMSLRLTDLQNRPLDFRSVDVTNETIDIRIFYDSPFGMARHFDLSLPRSFPPIPKSSTKSTAAAQCVQFELLNAKTVGALVRVCNSTASGWILDNRDNQARQSHLRSRFVYISQEQVEASISARFVPVATSAPCTVHANNNNDNVYLTSGTNTNTNTLTNTQKIWNANANTNAKVKEENGNNGNRIGEAVLRRRKRDRLGNAIVPLDSAWARYIELFIIVDSTARTILADNRIPGNLVKSQLHQIIYLANAMFQPVNVMIVLVNADVGGSSFKDVAENASDDALLRALQSHRARIAKREAQKIDHLLLITGRRVTQLGYIGSMCLDSSVSVLPLNMINGRLHDGWVPEAARSLTHLLGHSLGLAHDDESCTCGNSTSCVMKMSGSGNSSTGSSSSSSSASDSAGAVTGTEWSDCARKYLAQAPPSLQPADLCVLNKPKYIGRPKCGNLIVDKGEDCDCGDPITCQQGPSFGCCDPQTCRFREATYECSFGECCNMSSCSFRSASSVCRPAQDECDIGETCTGFAAECGTDVWIFDGASCADDSGYCHTGRCRTSTRQCRGLLRHARPSSNTHSLFSATSMHQSKPNFHEKSIETCSHYVNCLTSINNTDTSSCLNSTTISLLSDASFGCRRLACVLPAGYQAASVVHGINVLTVSASTLDAFINATVTSTSAGLRQWPTEYECAFFDAAKNSEYATLTDALINVADGTKCGTGKMCMKGQCTEIASSSPCRDKCKGNEVCDNSGNCHAIANVPEPELSPDFDVEFDPEPEPEREPEPGPTGPATEEITTDRNWNTDTDTDIDSVTIARPVVNGDELPDHSTSPTEPEPESESETTLTSTIPTPRTIVNVQRPSVTTAKHLLVESSTALMNQDEANVIGDGEKLQSWPWLLVVIVVASIAALALLVLVICAVYRWRNNRSRKHHRVRTIDHPENYFLDDDSQL